MADNQKTILNRILADIDGTYDKTKGSFAYDFCNAVAIEFQKGYAANQEEIRKKHINSAVGKELETLVKEYANMTRKNATYASRTVTIMGTVGAPIIEGELVSTSSLNYRFTESTVIQASGSINVTVQCTTIGSAGNTDVGTIIYFPKTLAGLVSVSNSEAFVNGYDEETDDELRTRYYEKIGEYETSGNEAQYKAWAKSITGVGDAKVISGTGAIEIVLINSNNLPADSILSDSVKTYILSVRPACSGTLAVIGASTVSITISVTLDMDTTNYTIDEINASIEDNITEYLADIAFNKDYVSYAQIGNKIFNSNGVNDYSNLLVNGGNSNILVENTEIAILGGITIG